MSPTIDTRGRDATLVLPDNSDADIQITVLDSAGSAVDLTGNTFTLDVLVDGVVELAATMGGTLGSGIITAAFDDDDLADLPASGLRWRLRNATSEVDWLSGMCLRSSVGSGTEATTEITVRLASSTAVTLVVGAVGAGPAGQGVPAGGTTGQALRKTSATDYATEWDTLTASDVGAAATSHTHAASDITSGLATVATSGAYSDLSGTPTIPSTAAVLHVYIWVTDEYVVANSGTVTSGAPRRFVGPNDPDGEGFTLVDGDEWVEVGA